MKCGRTLYIGSLLSTMFLAASCAPAPSDPPKPLNVPGLYAPGSTLGLPVPLPDAAVGYDVMMQRGPATDGCKGMFGPPGTEGKVTVTFSTVIVGQAWQPANVGAVWIEWVDPTDPKNFMKERFVRTLEKWANTRTESLETWTTRMCANKDDPDVMTQATRADHNAPHMGTWDTKDVNGQVVPDGVYKLYIEVTEYEEQGPIGAFEFTKGTTAFSLPLPDDRTNKGLTLTYTPGMQ